jgi:hypothetical protein
MPRLCHDLASNCKTGTLRFGIGTEVIKRVAPRFPNKSCSIVKIKPNNHSTVGSIQAEKFELHSLGNV